MGDSEQIDTEYDEDETSEGDKEDTDEEETSKGEGDKKGTEEEGQTNEEGDDNTEKNKPSKAIVGIPVNSDGPTSNEKQVKETDSNKDSMEYPRLLLKVCS